MPLKYRSNTRLQEHVKKNFGKTSSKVMAASLQCSSWTVNKIIQDLKLRPKREYHPNRNKKRIRSKFFRYTNELELFIGSKL